MAAGEGERGVERLEGGAELRQEHSAEGGRGDATAPPLEHRAAKLFLALDHLLANRADGDAELFRGGAERAEPPYRLDRPQPIEPDMVMLHADNLNDHPRKLH